MKLIVTIAVLLLALPAVPQSMASRSPWERVLLPPVKNPMGEQCAIVDADLYAHAAPGLRDVRLLQDGQELPYAMDESHDDSGEAAERGRALFDAVAQAKFVGAANGAASASILLPPRVPVERITLRAEKMPPSTRLTVAATPRNVEQAGTSTPASEIVSWNATADRPSEMVTLGANLQTAATVTVTSSPAPVNASIVLEMRRREVCYQPRSMSSVHLLLGNADVLPARYDYAQHYQPRAEPLLAAMGPLRANPAYSAPSGDAPLLRVPAGTGFAVTVVIVLGSLAVVAFALYELRRR